MVDLFFVVMLSSVLTAQPFSLPPRFTAARLDLVASEHAVLRGVVGAVIVVVGAAGSFVAIRACRSPPTAPPAAVAPESPHDRYVRDRDRLRFAHPQTERDLVGLLAREPDRVVESDGTRRLIWTYGQGESIEATVQDGRVVRVEM